MSFHTYIILKYNEKQDKRVKRIASNLTFEQMKNKIQTRISIMGNDDTYIIIRDNSTVFSIRGDIQVPKQQIINQMEEYFNGGYEARNAVRGTQDD